MLSAAQLLSDVNFIISDLPTRDDTTPEAVIGANTYPVARNVLDRDKLMQVEGVDNRYRFSLYANAKSVDDNGDRPEVNELVTYDGIEFTVLATTDDPIEQLLRLDLGEEFARNAF
jgi:hypothetical protein